MVDSAVSSDDVGAAPWRGKRRVVDAKEKFIAVRCTEADRARIQAKAAEKGLSIGAYLRAVALGSAGPRAVKRPRVEREELARLLAQVGMIGSNVNQVARWCNSVRDAPNRRELELMRADIATIRAGLMQALGREP